MIVHQLRDDIDAGNVSRIAKVTAQYGLRKRNGSFRYGFIQQVESTCSMLRQCRKSGGEFVVKVQKFGRPLEISDEVFELDRVLKGWRQAE